MCRNSHTTAQHQTVHESNVRLREIGDAVVQRVLHTKVFLTLLVVFFFNGAIERDHVATGTQTALTGAANQNRLDSVVLLKLGEGSIHPFEHLIVQRVDSARTIKGNNA